LLAAYFLSKVIPVAVLLRYFDVKRVSAASFLLTSTLSLVIAAAVIAEQIGMISDVERGMFILSAVIACIITPVLFKQLYPVHEEVDKVINVTIIGNNQLTVPVAKAIAGGLYNVKLIFHRNFSNSRGSNKESLTFHEIPEYSKETLSELDAFDTDILVVGANDSSLDWQAASLAADAGADRISYRGDGPRQGEEGNTP